MASEATVEVLCVLDRSGSMGAIESDAIGGFNKFLQQQKAQEGRARFTLVLFNHQYQVLYDGVDIQDVPPLDSETYGIAGTTALLDAVGRTIDTARNRLAKLDEGEQPDAVILAILTDGLENASREYSPQRVFEMVTERREAGWEVIFLGADQDAVKEASRIGVRSEDAYDYRRTGEGVREAYRKMSARTTGTRRKAMESRRKRREGEEKDDESTGIGFKP